MARKTKLIVICDRHRGEVEAATTVEIAFDGDRKRLDLCAEHAAELRRALRPWLRAASPAGPARSTRRSARSGQRPRRSTDGPAIRAWAREQGIEVPDRGRIPAAVREAYAKAH